MHAIKDAMHNAKKMTKFSVWHDDQEQWDEDAIDEPALVCEAESALVAAERLADDTDDNHVTVIVLDHNAGEYRIIELRREWGVKSNRSTSLKKLCAP